MTLKELENKAREVCPEWLQAEIDEFIEHIKFEMSLDPESWEYEWDFFDVLNHFENSDEWSGERRFKLALTKIERHIGIQRKLGKGESCAVFTSSGGTRRFKEGDWIYDKRVDQLINQ